MIQKEKENNKSIFVAKKNKEIFYLNKAKEYFEDKNKFLQIDTNIAVGNFYLNNKKYNRNISNNKIKYDSEDKNIPFQKPFNTIESKKVKNKNNSFKIISRPLTENKISSKSRNNNNYKLFLNSKSKKNLTKYYEFKSPADIVELFNYHRNIHNINKQNKENKNLSKITNNYIQEKTLMNYKMNSTKNKIFLELLSRKCKKKKKNLLLNKTDNYLYKKQLINYAYNNKSLAEKFGDFFWILNLKRSEKTKKEYKRNFLKIGKNGKNEILSELFFDPGNDDLELVVNQNISGNIQKDEKYNFLKSFDGLRVDGANLLEKEYNSFRDQIIMGNKKNNIKFKLYKDPSEKRFKNIKNLIFKDNYLLYKKNKKNENKLKKSFSANHKNNLINNKREKENNYIFL